MQPGSIVRCVDDTNWCRFISQNFPTLPVKGGLYTIRRIVANTETPDGPPGLALEEIRGKWDYFHTYLGIVEYEEYQFRMNRFEEVLPPMSINSLMEEIIEQPLFNNQ